MLPGTVGWIDLTVEDAPRIRSFYESVVGWVATDVPMGDYADYAMGPPGGDAVAGVCHARGVNRGAPPVWMVYFVVDDLDVALIRAAERGGRVVDGPRGSGARFAIVQDPSGATFALWQGPP